MIEILYSLWAWIAGLGAIVGIVSGVLSAKKDSKEILLKIFMTVGIVIATLALAVSIVYTKVPSVQGSELRTAIHYLEEADLNATMLPGVTLDDNSQDIVKWVSEDNGTMVLKNTNIVLMTDSYSVEKPTQHNTSERVSVPNVLGKEQNEAIKLLTDSGLEFQVWWYEEDFSEDNIYYVIEQSIPADSEVDNGTLIRLHISGEKQ